MHPPRSTYYGGFQTQWRWPFDKLGLRLPKIHCHGKRIQHLNARQAGDHPSYVGYCQKKTESLKDLLKSPTSCKQSIIRASQNFVSHSHPSTSTLQNLFWNYQQLKSITGRKTTVKSCLISLQGAQKTVYPSALHWKDWHKQVKGINIQNLTNIDVFSLLLIPIRISKHWMIIKIAQKHAHLKQKAKKS